MSAWMRAVEANFNPRSREGSDYPKTVFHILVAGISIHAPVKGATCGQPTVRPGTTHFNPRSREGSDWFICVGFLVVNNFNPRSREGSDCRSHRNSRTCRYFNPRSREGSDSATALIHPIPTDFNPRSREGSDCRKSGTWEIP